MLQWIAIRIGLVLMLLGCNSAQGGGLSNATLNAEKSSISSQYQHDLALCNTLSTSSRAICISGVEGNKQVTEAKLEARDEPSAQHNMTVRMARAQTDYELAMKKCRALTTAAQKKCAVQAERRLAQAKTDTQAAINSADVHSTQQEKAVDRSLEANQDKNRAAYLIAKDQCEQQSQHIQQQAACIQAAKKRYQQE